MLREEMLLLDPDQGFSPPQRYTATLRWQLFGRNHAAFLSQQHAQERLAALLHHLPPAWVAAAQQHATQPPPPSTATSLLCSCLGWQLEGNAPLPLPDYTVRSGTQLLLTLAGQLQQRAARFAAFCTEALGTGAGEAACNAQWLSCQRCSSPSGVSPGTTSTTRCSGC